MKRDFETEFLTLNDEYSVKYNKLNLKINLYTYILAFLGLLTGCFIKLAIYYSCYIFFIFMSVVLFIADAAVIKLIKRNNNVLNAISKSYVKNCCELKKDAAFENTEIVSAYQGTRDIKISVFTVVSIVITAAVMLGIFSWLQDYSIQKWFDYKSLRPFMAEDLGRYQNSVSYDETGGGNKEEDPDLLRSYTRDELTEMFSSDKKNDADKDIIISYSDNYDGALILDAHYSFTDPFGRDFWVLIFYRIKDGVPVYTYSDVRPSGTRVELDKYGLSYL